MKNVKVKIKCDSPYGVPEYKTTGSVGMDVRFYERGEERVVLKPGQRRLMGTGLRIQLPEGYEAQVRPRSGLALNQGVTVLNTPGTVDADYRGEIGIVLINNSSCNVEIKSGERIAQLVFQEVAIAQLEVVEELDTTDRGSGGFGHTGKA